MSTCIWTANGSTDLLDMVFISPNLAKHDIQFQIGDDLGSDHLPIEVSIDVPPHRNSSTNHTKYKFDQTDREVFESTLKAALGSADFSGLMSTSDLHKYADFIVSAISTAVYKAIPKSKSVRSKSNPISDETIVLIKEKRRLGRQHSQKKDPAVKTCINPSGGDFLMSGIGVCATDQGRFFTSKNPEQAPNFEVLLQNRPYLLKFCSRTGFFFDNLVSNARLKCQNPSCFQLLFPAA